MDVLLFTNHTRRIVAARAAKSLHEGDGGDEEDAGGGPQKNDARTRLETAAAILLWRGLSPSLIADGLVSPSHGSQGRPVTLSH